MALKIAVVYGSVRKKRKGLRAAKWICRELGDQDHDATLIDPQEYELPLMDKRYFTYDDGEAPERLEAIHGIFDQADAIVVVTAEYNHGVPPALKNLMDYFFHEYDYKISGIVSYSAGSFGGVRAAVQWRAILAEYGMPSIPMVLAIPRVGDAFDNDGYAVEDKESWDRRVNKFGKQLAWYARALKEARKDGTP